MRYPAVVTKEGKNLLADFPTCPGCHTFAPPGLDIEHEAKEALELWLESHLHESVKSYARQLRRLGPGRERARVLKALRDHLAAARTPRQLRVPDAAMRARR